MIYIRTFVLLLLVSLPSIASAVDAERCAQLLSEYSGIHVKNANKIREKHEKALNKVLARFGSAYDGSREPIDAAIAHIRNRHDIASIRKEYVEGVVSSLQDYIDGLTDESECLSEDTLEYRSSNWNRIYEYHLESLRRDIADRLELETLAEDEGLAIVAFYSFGLAQEVRVNRRDSLLGTFTFGPVVDNEYFRVMKLKAGTYFWDRISREFYGGEYYHDYSKRGFEFSIEAGKLNYTGVFVYDSVGRMARGSHNDRTAIVLTLIEQRYPDLLERFEFVNGLVPDDPFIEYYLSEKERHGSNTLEK